MPPSVTSGLENLDYEAWLAGSTESADVAVPLIMDAIHPTSVADVGCGLGAWLAVFKQHGVEDVLGYDGPWVDRSHLLVAPAEFQGADLREPLAVERRFDLAICLEVAHMLEPEHATTVVEALVALADVVVFSAGIPGQGASMHRNEQWPEHWAGLFAAHGYSASDPFRLALWEEPAVKWWFAQNMLCYAEPAALAGLPVLDEARCERAPLSLVHPGCLGHVLGEIENARPRRPTLWPRRRSLLDADDR